MDENTTANVIEKHQEDHAANNQTPQLEEPQNQTPAKDDDSIDYKALYESEKRERAKLKESFDKASSELSAKKKADRQNMSELERLREETAEQIEDLKKQNEALKRDAAMSTLSKRVMTIVKDEKTATELAGFLYGAADADGFIDGLEKFWIRREKELRLEYGKPVTPGAGTDEESPEEKQRKSYLELAKRMGATTALLSQADNGLSKYY